MIKADKVGISLSVICAIHCAATPIMLTAFPLIGAEIAENHFLEIFLLSASMLFAGYTLLKDFFNHRKAAAVLLCLAGFTSVVLSHYVPAYFNNIETVMAVSGGFMVAASYFLNWKLKKTCKLVTSKI